MDEGASESEGASHSVSQVSPDSDSDTASCGSVTEYAITFECEYRCGFHSDSYDEVADHEKRCHLRHTGSETGGGSSGSDAKDKNKYEKEKKAKGTEEETEKQKQEEKEKEKANSCRKTSCARVHRPRRPQGSGESDLESVPWSARIKIASYLGGEEWLEGCAHASVALAEGTRYERLSSCGSTSFCVVPSLPCSVYERARVCSCLSKSWLTSLCSQHATIRVRCD